MTHPVPLLLAAFVAAFALCLLLTPLVRAAARRWGLVDEPDGHRKIHARPIPVAGGVAVLLATAVVLAALVFASDSWRAALGQRWLPLVGLAAASALIAVVGVLDDYKGLLGRHKLVGQLMAVGVVVGCGVEIRSIRIFDWTTPEFGALTAPLTAFWLLLAINSLNLIDGMDGLLGSLGGIICGSLAVMAALNGHLQVAVVAAAMSGALWGFLFFNFPPATIFLGDCGSMLIGLVVGVLAIEGSLKGPATVALAAPAALLIIPLLDTAAAVVRRKLTGRSIYETDRGHLHHCLQGHGLSNARILLLVGGLSLTASCGALFTQWFNSELFALISTFIVVGTLLLFRLFGHAEFLLIKERLLAIAFAVRYGNDQGRIHQLEVRLQGSADWNDLWKNVTAFAEQLRLKSVCLDVNAPAMHEGYHARWGRVQGHSDSPGCWRTEVPLAANGQVVGRLEVTGQRDGRPVAETIALVAKIVEDVEAVLAGLTAAPAVPRLEEFSPPDSVGLESVTTA